MNEIERESDRETVKERALLQEIIRLDSLVDQANNESLSIPLEQRYILLLHTVKKAEPECVDVREGEARHSR